MFRKQTVFILGAGASWHYGYPTGEELVARVIKVAEQLTSYFQIGFKHESGSIPAFALANINYQPGLQVPVSVWSAAARKSIQLGRRLKEVNPTLIDYFLAQNSDLHDIGRLAIALVIFSCEADFNTSGGNPNHRQQLSLRVGRGESTANPATLDLTSFKDDWLRFVLYNLTVNCETSETLTSNAVTFVTFNYDTSLEQRLYSGLNNISHFEKSHVRKFIDADRFLHVYGAIRETIDDQWKPLDVAIPQHYNGNFHNFREVLDRVFQSSRGIRTIDGNDKVANDVVIAKAQKAIAAAEAVYILGFGFDASNVHRLSMEALRPIGPASRKVFFTNFRQLDSVAMAAGRVLVNSPRLFLSGSPSAHETTRQMDKTIMEFRYQMSDKNVYDAIAEDFEFMGSVTA